MPEVHRRQQEIDRAIQSIGSLERISLTELLSARHAGHKY
jgi:hypothetical protein